MATFILRRLLQTVIVLLIVTMLVFLIMQLLPGDPARIMLGSEATQEQIDLLREEMGLDQPLPVQYLHWLGNVLQGDLGKSLYYKDAVTGTIATRLPITLQLGIYSLLLALLIGIPAGVIAAVKRGSAWDSAVLLISNSGISIPSFWLAILGVYLFSMQLGWLPVQGYVSPWEDFGESVKHMLMPIFVLALASLASIARQTRSAMLEVIRQDYIRTARSKGSKERLVIVKHALRNALIPIITLLGLQLGHIVGGMVFIESVFNIPGMGRLIVQSILNQDFIVVQGCVLVIAAIVALVNLIVDITYSYVDPRIHYE
ncbi:ABC transporter permease [Paenibacillus validus]|uniref:ABC transporter permease subunit n=1 Tax=Paenibacillus validus TaxID=44253 RepID=A0A7X2Z827_9BACL|nr:MULTISPECIES: ABC transporter permease [Paenibacillus]MED4601611.1 ABC transporter permease [Paenibacillus validus]MED4605646.1 ABC transporter permease [Paenibacillus validus]MUG70038.1 ABC transporter permease subunit [Paenibacillus validus]